jgi:hypothetical protein
MCAGVVDGTENVDRLAAKGSERNGHIRILEDMRKMLSGSGFKT